MDFGYLGYRTQMLEKDRPVLHVHVAYEDHTDGDMHLREREIGKRAPFLRGAAQVVYSLVQVVVQSAIARQVDGAEPRALQRIDVPAIDEPEPVRQHDRRVAELAGAS